MSNRLPVEVNPFRLIEQRRQLSGNIRVSTLPRLQELLVQQDSGESVVGEGSEFLVELEFDYSPSKLPMISGTVCGSVALECQRCLQPVLVELDTRLDVVVTASETDRQPEDEGYEICIVADERLFLKDFIEDEILLTLPVVARHDSCEQVSAPHEAGTDEVLADSAEKIGHKNTGHPVTEHQQEEEKDNPFAVLKDWKKT